MKQTKKQTKQGIKRRSFLKKAAAGTAGVAAATVAAPAISQGRQEVVMVSTWGGTSRRSAPTRRPSPSGSPTCPTAG